MRFALNAASIAKHRGLPILPSSLWDCTLGVTTGLEQMSLSNSRTNPRPSSRSLRSPERLSSGIWEEPPSDQVHNLRDTLFSSLSEVTPDAPDWETYSCLASDRTHQGEYFQFPAEIIQRRGLAAREVRAALSDGQTRGPDGARYEAARF